MTGEKQPGRRTESAPERITTALPLALDRWVEIAAELAGKKPALFLDYDGTLTPIVSRPEDASLADSTRTSLRRLSALTTVAVVSGREREDVATLVGLQNLYYVGSHGFDIAGPDLERMHPDGVRCLDDLEQVETRLHERLAPIQGSLVERKRFSVAVHYRNVPPAEYPRVERIVEEEICRFPTLRKALGKKVFELRPAADWDKGQAVLWLLDQLGLDRPGVVPIYVGDDLTDEDAFRALEVRGIGIFVGEANRPTRARYRLRDTAEVAQLLQELQARLEAELAQ